jgi:hypothetical protein
MALQRSLQESGELVGDGKWVNAAGLRADGGWREIDAKWRELNPGDFAKFEEWNKAGAPEASYFFALVSAREVA